MKKFALLCVFALLLTAAAYADQLAFDLQPPTNYASIDDNGFGQGVIVSSTQTISDMEFYFNMPSGGDAQFMIWDGTNSNLLLTNFLTLPASNKRRL